MDNFNLISVIVPVYNVEKYLDQCVESIVNQTYKNLEIILVDDGSPDNCPAICDEWAKKDERIVVIHKNNGGLSSARNAGLDVAHGEYIGFVDSDDYIDSDMYEQLLNAITDEDAELSCCGRRIVDEQSSVQCDRYTHERTSYIGNDIVKSLFYGNEFDEAMWDKLYKKSFFNNLRFPIGEVNEDIVLMVKKFSSLNTMVHLGAAKYYYRNNTQGITKSKYNGKMSIVIKHLYEIKAFVVKTIPQLLPDYYFLQARYSCSQLINIYLSKGAKKEFYHDFKAYRKLLIDSMKYVMKSKNISKKNKLHMMLLKYHLWGILYKIKNII